MEIKDLQAKQGDVELTATVIDKSNPRSFDKFGKQGVVCNAKIQDETGKVTLTLWNDDVEKVSVGDTIKIIKGYVGEWQGELQLSAGKFGTIEVVSKAPPSKAQHPEIEENLIDEGYEEPDVDEDII